MCETLRPVLPQLFEAFLALMNDIDNEAYSNPNPAPLTLAQPVTPYSLPTLASQTHYPLYPSLRLTLTVRISSRVWISWWQGACWGGWGSGSGPEMGSGSGPGVGLPVRARAQYCCGKVHDERSIGLGYDGLPRMPKWRH